MHQIQLDDNVYKRAKQRADEAGFATVDELVVDMLSDDDFTVDTTTNFDHLFTPEVILDLERQSAEIKAGGKTYTVAEVDEHFRKRFGS